MGLRYDTFPKPALTKEVENALSILFDNCDRACECCALADKDYNCLLHKIFPSEYIDVFDL